MAGIFIKNFFAYKTQKSRYGEGFDLEQTMLMDTCTTYMYLPRFSTTVFSLHLCNTDHSSKSENYQKKKKHAQAHVPFSIAGKPLYRDPDCL